MHPQTPAQTACGLTPSTPKPSAEFGPGATHPTACAHADHRRATAAGRSHSDDDCAPTDDGHAAAHLGRTVEHRRVPEPFPYRGKWRGQLPLIEGRRLMAEFDTKAQCAEWIERQLVQRQAEIAPPKAPSVTDSDLQRGYARLLGTKVNANCAQVDPATGATTWATLAERARPELADQCASLPFENGWQAEQAAKTVDESVGAAGQLMRLHAARSEGCASTHSVPPRSRRNTGRGGFGVPEPRRVESGGWRVQVTTFDGCRRSRTFRTHFEASKWAKDEFWKREYLSAPIEF